YVDTAAVNKQYADKIKEAHEQLENLLQMAAQAGASNKDSIETAKAVIEPMFQAFEDSKGLVLGMEFRPDGFALTGQAMVTPDSRTNKFLKGSRPAPLADLGELPGGYLIYDAAAVSPELIEKFALLFLGAIKGDGAESKELKEAVRDLESAKPRMR